MTTGDRGFVTNGYVTEGDHVWWQVDWQDGPEGWSAETFLASADNGDGVDGRDPLPFDSRTDLTDPIAITGGEIDAAMAAVRPESPLIGLGDVFATVQDEYGTNALYQTAHAVHESDWGTSDIAQDHNNLFGYGADDDCPYECAERYDSFEECVWEVMDDIYELCLTPGNWRYNGPHLDGMNEYYATDPEWDRKIADHYRTLANNR